MFKMMKFFTAILFLSLISCKEEKPKYHFSFFDDVDKVEHLTFEENKFPREITSKKETLPKILSSRTISSLVSFIISFGSSLFNNFLNSIFFLFDSILNNFYQHNKNANTYRPQNPFF